GTLNRRVLAVSLGHRNLLTVLFVIAEANQPARSGSRLTFTHGAVRGFIQISIELSIGREVFLQDAFSLRHTQPGHYREALRADAVNHTEIQTLGKITLFSAHLIHRDVENFRSRHSMEIRARPKGVNES